MSVVQRQHGGHLRRLAEQSGRSPEQILDFSANLNPLGYPEMVRPTISRHLEQIAHYPDPESRRLVGAIAAARGLDADCIVAGNGSMELLFAITRALAHTEDGDEPLADRAVVLNPCFSGYAQAAAAAGLPVEGVGLDEAACFEVAGDVVAERLRPGDVIFLGQPNNPTGRLCDARWLHEAAAAHPRTWFVIDEAFADFVPGVRSIACERLPNVVVVRSLTKFYTLPGLRLGYAVVPEQLLSAIVQQVPCWSVNALAQAVGEAVLGDEAYACRTRESVAVWRERLCAELRSIGGLKVYPGVANFLLVRVSSAADVADRLLNEHGIAVRRCENFSGLGPDYLRVAVRTDADNQRLVDALRHVLHGRPRRPRKRRHTPAIMFQGTSSYVGKSVMTAGLCRVLLQDGVRVAPFKSQNMSLNSFVTRDGGEIGRAQVVQAQACRLEPDVRMNPILLKPNSDTGSQVMVNGRSIGNMKAAAYHARKRELFAQVTTTYDALAAEHEVMLIEGAGSAGEVNLKKHDIVNMRVADHAGAAVLLVGDIDRGGVFASFIGTMEVMPEWERRLVAGFVINRFRGDATLLNSASDYTRLYTGRDVVGLVPYIHDINLPEEDSFGFRDRATDESSRAADGECVDVAIVDVPRISNFTDFDALRLEPDVRVRIVRTPEQLDGSDLVILPGSKNTISDLQHLKQTGMAEAIRRVAAAGSAEVVGICGGLQMLGRRIADPQHTESTRGAIEGLGLLDVETTHMPDKTLQRVRGTHVESGLEVTGYEIHHGRTDLAAGIPALRYDDGTVAGIQTRNGRVWGSYLHGIFDSDGFRRWLVNRLRQRKGWQPRWHTGVSFDLEPALDHLADVVREGMDMDTIYALLDR